MKVSEHLSRTSGLRPGRFVQLLEMHRPKTFAGLAVVALCAFAVAPACTRAPPSIHGPPSAIVGALLTVRGELWLENTAVRLPICTIGKDRGHDGIELFLAAKEGGDADDVPVSAIKLGVFDAGDDGEFSVTLRIPESVEPGRYLLLARATPELRQWIDTQIRLTAA